MRRFIDIITENVLEVPDYFGGLDIRVWVNPTAKQIFNASYEMRGLIVGPDVYVWKAFEACHESMERGLQDIGFFDPENDRSYGISISNGKVYAFNTPALEAAEAHPVVQKWGYEVDYL